MTRLIYVPVVHSTADMGSAAAAYRAAFVARYGEAKWHERAVEFDTIWNAIAASIDALGLDLTRVKLYQDSLPVCGHEEALVRDLAAQGSHNHQLLLRLAERGAAIVGTESPTLLLEEYRLLQSSERTEAAAAALLEARDRFIAARIEETLGPDEVGILFIGALHHVANFLPSRIPVEILPLRGQ